VSLQDLFRWMFVEEQAYLGPSLEHESHRVDVVTHTLVAPRW
jgi:hypothetical protein